ncbi:hypothetical protein NQZ68_037834 [Dissostichus eleginoides]|nr:hypothetical protein NQZ68_037834 [Dissostichus eleginoides]
MYGNTGQWGVQPGGGRPPAGIWKPSISADRRRRGIANRPTDWRSAADLIGEAHTELGRKKLLLTTHTADTEHRETPLEFLKPSSSPQVGHEVPSRPGSLSS